MSHGLEEEIRANLERANEALSAARLLLEQSLYNSAASRAYYAAFHAATAALLGEGDSLKTHSGVLAAFHRSYVKSGRVDAEQGKALNQLFELRSIGDYGELQHVTFEEASFAVRAAEAFVAAAREAMAST